MKKLLLSLLLLIPFLLMAQSPTPIQLQTRAKECKKKKVKTVSVYIQKEGEEKTLSYIDSFSKKGLLLKSFENTEWDGAINSQYEYSKKGLLEKKTTINEKGNIISTIAYSYKNKQLIKEQHNDSDEEEGDYEYSIIYNYNDNGQIDSSFVADAEFRQNVWKYNNNGLLTTILGYTIYNFDKPNDWVVVDSFGYEYNDNNLMVTTATCYSSIGCSSLKKEYNSKKQHISSIHYEDEGEKVGESSYEYNPKGLVSKSSYTDLGNSMYSSPNSVTTYEYTYY